MFVTSAMILMVVKTKVTTIKNDIESVRRSRNNNAHSNDNKTGGNCDNAAADDDDDEYDDDRHRDRQAESKMLHPC